MPGTKEDYDINFDIDIPTEDEIRRRVKSKPYLKAITKLREVSSCDGPMKKLKLLNDVNKLII